MLKKIIATVLLAVVCVAAIHLGRKWTSPKGHPKLERRNLERAKGNPNAPLWIVEYMDFQCEGCKAASKIVHDVMEAHPDQIYYQIRFYPLLKNHRYALKTSIYAECAAKQKKFWPYHDRLFLEKDRWSVSGKPDTILRELAKQSGMNLKALDACVDNPQTKAAVMKEKEDGILLNITSTPTFYFNGEKVVGLDMLEQEFKKRFPEGKQK